MAQAEAGRLAAENRTLQTVVRVLIAELSDEQYDRAHRRLERIDAGEEGGNEPSG